MRRLLQLALLLLWPSLALGQTTTVTGTNVTDPNGNQYANGTASAAIQLATGAPIAGLVLTRQVSTNSVGTFSFSGSNALSSNQAYIFTICAMPVQIGPLANPTPKQVCFSTPPITVSGASQDITTQANAAAAVLGPQLLTGITLNSNNVWTGSQTINNSLTVSGAATLAGLITLSPGASITANGQNLTFNSASWWDAVLNCNFSSDCHIRNTNATTTATTSCSGSNQVITVGSTSSFNTLNQGALFIDHFQSDFEVVGAGSWSVQDSTHLVITCGISHTQPFTVEMIGQVRMESSEVNFLDTDFINSPIGIGLTGTASGTSREGMISMPILGSVLFKTGLNGNHIPRWYGDTLGNGLTIFGSGKGACVGVTSGCVSGTGTSGPINFSTNETDDPNGTVAGIIIQPGVKAIDISEQASAPAAPAASHVRMYSKSTTDLVYTKNGGNTEAVLSVFPTASLPVSGHVIAASGANGVLQDTGIASPVAAGAATMTQTIASGTATMPTSAVAAVSGSTITCVAAAGNPISATGVATTDTVTWSPSAVESSPNTGLIIRAWPTSGGVNFEYCNPTASSLTPGAETLNWRVVR